MRAACEEAAGAEAGAANEASRSTALHRAAQAIGEAETSGPDAPKVAQLEAGEDELGVVSVRMRYGQLRQVCDAKTGKGVGLDEWEREQGGWLRRARQQGTAEGRWSAHTRHGFRRGAGAAHRKEVETVAVAPSGEVYAVAQPGSWPKQLRYDVLVRCRVEGTVRHDVIVSLRLHEDRGGKVAISVSAQPADAEGRQTRSAGVTGQHVNAPLGGADLLGAARALFWVHEWAGAPAPREGARGLLLAAAETAAANTADAWEAMRRALSGELPQQTMAERMQEKQQREERQEAAEAAGAAAGSATMRARAARARAGRRRPAGAPSDAGGAGGAETADGDATAAAAGVLGVPTGAEREVVRSRYLRLAMKHHPDKGGEDAAQFRAVQDAYEEMNRHTPEERRRMEAERQERGRPATGGSTEGETETEDGEEVERAEAAEVKAVAEWTVAAEDAARPRGWTQVALRLKEAAAIYFREWHAFQRAVQRKRAEIAKTEGYETHAARCAARARQREEERRTKREAADTAALEAMRQEERNNQAVLRERRRQEVEQLRELSIKSLGEAIKKDYPEVARKYVVKVPWAMWCEQRCVCKSRAKGCEHRSSDEYTNYDITEVSGSGEDMQIRVERTGMTSSERKERAPARGDGSTWNVFTLTWRRRRRGSRDSPRASMA